MKHWGSYVEEEVLSCSQGSSDGTHGLVLRKDAVSAEKGLSWGRLASHGLGRPFATAVEDGTAATS